MNNKSLGDYYQTILVDVFKIPRGIVNKLSSETCVAIYRYFILGSSVNK